MKIVILTQDEPFFLAKNIEYLAENLSDKHEIKASVVFDVSPFGGKQSFIDKAKRTLNIFGAPFFVYYGFKFVKSKLFSKTVTQVLKEKGIDEIRLEKSVNHKSSLDIIESYNPDLLISIAGNQIFKSKLINLAPKGCINLHTALLPKYRGLMPSFWVLKNNEKKTGVSVFFVDEGIDSGPIIVQREVVIGNRSQEELIRDTKKIGMDAILEAIDIIDKGDVKTKPNPDDEMTYYTFPTKDDVKVFKKNGKKFF